MRPRSRSSDFLAPEVRDLLKLARECSVDRLWRPRNTLRGQVVVALDGPPAALAIPLAAAVAQLGGTVVNVDATDLSVTAAPTLAASAAIVVVAATVDDAVLAALGSFGVPTLDARPAGGRRLQMLADLLAVENRFGPFNELRVACLGEASTAAPVVEAFAAAGAAVSVAMPPGDLIAPAVIARAAAHGERSGNPFTTGHDPRTAITGADVVYTDTWPEPGGVPPGFRVDAGLLSLAGSRAVVLHGLTRLPGTEVDPSVTGAPAWLAYNQLVNRLPAALALLHTVAAGRGHREEKD